MTNKRIHIIVSGRVQGVFYRASTRDKAKELNLKGWVKNLSDGRVELIAEGEEQSIKDLFQWCKQGPPHAFVTDIQFQEENPTEEFSDFQITF